MRSALLFEMKRERAMQRRDFLISAAAAIAAAWPLRAQASGGGGGDMPGTKHVTVDSGVAKKVAGHGYQVDPRSFSLKITKRPQNGTARIVRTSKGASDVIYQSRKGYVGEDSCTYVRVGSDARAGTYVIAITVK
jgi:hypothetical protein